MSRRIFQIAKSVNLDFQIERSHPIFLKFSRTFFKNSKRNILILCIYVYTDGQKDGCKVGQAVFENHFTSMHAFLVLKDIQVHYIIETVLITEIALIILSIYNIYYHDT
jgi:hypothetical protein